MILRTLISKTANSEIFRGIKPKLIAAYEKFYDYRRTVQMHVLSRKDDAYAKAHPLKIMQLDETLKYILEKSARLPVMETENSIWCLILESAFKTMTHFWSRDCVRL